MGERWKKLSTKYWFPIRTYFRYFLSNFKSPNTPHTSLFSRYSFLFFSKKERSTLIKLRVLIQPSSINNFYLSSHHYRNWRNKFGEVYSIFRSFSSPHWNFLRFPCYVTTIMIKMFIFICTKKIISIFTNNWNTESYFQCILQYQSSN